jgi:hypothetical protein
VTVTQGVNVTYTITPASGYHVANVLVDSVSVGTPSTYTFTSVSADHTIAVTFAANTVATFTITPTASANGTISPATPQTVASGSSMTFIMHPATGFHVSDVLVDSVSVGAVGSYTFSNITANHTISVSFAANAVGMFTITPSAGPNGSITPTAAQVVNAGSNVTFNVTPNVGYHVESLLVDGSTIATATSYTFTNVQANHTISATFSNDTDTAVASAITLHASSTNVRVNHSINLTSVLVDYLGTPLAGVNVSYQVMPVGSNHWIPFTPGPTLTTDTNGSSTTALYRVVKHGTYRFRVLFLGDDDFFASTSRVVSVTVR